MSRTGLADELPELEASLLEDLSPRNVMRVADACRLAGRPERAVELLDVLLAERPVAIAPLVLKAWCLADLGRGEESAQALEELRAIDPANPWASGRAIPEPVLVSSEPEPEPAREPEPAAEAVPAAEPETEIEIEHGASVELEAATEVEVEPEPDLAQEDAEPDPEEPLGGAFAEALAEEDDPEDGAAAEEPGAVVFEIPEGTTDLAAAVAAMANVELEQEPGSEPVAAAEAEPEPASEPQPATEVESEPPLGASEPETEPAPAAFEPPDEEAEAEPERALTEEELADVPPSPLYSATLAEIFERQGFEEKAMEIYAEVVRTHPERVDLRERIAELERRLPAEPGG